MDYFVNARPCDVGISAKYIKKYMSLLKRYNSSTHSVIMARGNKIFFEHYTKPFDKDFSHRMYSVTKSFVSIAIGFLVEDGVISLDDKIVKFFPEDIPENLLENVKNQTVRDMLMMSTGYISKRNNWFKARPDDRVKFYFETSVDAPDDSEEEISRIPGRFFEYDSNGSFILGAMVERVTGKSLAEFLYEKLFDKIGVTSARFLKCPGGHSWSDSALLCTPLDMLKVARFVLNYGEWQGEQILSSDYLKEATSKQIDNAMNGIPQFNAMGYGYKFWRTWQDSFFFNGMGNQFIICVPHKDLILVHTGDNQGYDLAKSVIIDRFFEEIVDNIDIKEIPDDTQNEKELAEYSDNFSLYALEGEKTSPIIDKINGKTYILNENPMGIKKLQFKFSGDKGSFIYENAQGKKELPFKLCENEYCIFPEEGYSLDVGSKPASGNFYKCACSAAFTNEDTFGIMVQAIDDYFGRLYMAFNFKDDTVALNFTKTAEDFFNEYEGYADGKMI